MCLEELAEALTFAHYLRTQTLIGPADLNLVVQDLTRQGAAPSASEDTVMTDDGPTPAPAPAPAPAPDSAPDSAPAPASASSLPAVVDLTQEDYLYGVFDLTGEMMRFATTSTALSGTMGMAAGAGAGAEGNEEPRTIVADMHELGSFFEMLPVGAGNKFQWNKKLDVTRQSVRKVERLGYDRTIRGSERPKGWVPDLSGVGDVEEEE